jgi:peptide/nickel transport system substrate-binding protein
MARRHRAFGGLAAMALVVASAMPAPVFAKSDTLVIAARNNLRGNYNPYESPSGMNFFMTPVFETLLVQDASGNIQPSLATKWSVSEDNTVLTLTLRDGVTFHNGKPFNANAVKASLELGKTAETSAVKPTLSEITSIDVIDDRTIALKFAKGGAARAVGMLALASGAIVEAQAAKDPGYRTHPIGTGPWMVSDDSDPTSEMVYEAYPKYWDKKAQGVDRIEIKVLSQQAAQNGLLDGSIHFAEVANRDGAVAAQKAGLVNVDSSSAQMMWVFQLNKNPGKVFADKNLRLALAYAIDRKALLKDVFSEISLESCLPSSQPFPSASPYYDATLPGIEYNPEKAKEYLAAAGKPNGFQFTASASSSFVAFGTLLTAIKPQLAKVGITMNIELQPLTSLAPDWIAGKYDAKFEGVINPIQYYGPADIGKVDDEEWHKSLAASVSAPTLDAQKEALKQWSRRFQEIASTVSICSLGQSGWVQKNVRGLRYLAPQWIDFKNVTIGN